MYDNFDILKFNYPTSPGWEGAGTVVSSGGGMMANRAVGKRCAFMRQMSGNEFTTGGTYQQYSVADAMSVNVCDPAIPSDVASMSFINPLTALGLVESI